ncbi:MAG TPA: dehydrogenase [Alphaproteobacteria bacterium]|nr:dehydrogenase [Alphaproteobacteria bacterium]
MKAGVIGLGDMGSGLAKNLIANGFETSGFDVSDARMAQFAGLGGVSCADAGGVGRHADIVFVMVMNGDQAKQVILGDDGLVAHMAEGGIIILTATIRPSEAREIGEALGDAGIRMIDSPVSGGFPGAQNGTLTMMAAAPEDLMAAARPIMEAVSGTIHHVGKGPGEGQVMKSCLQSIIGSIFSATFEAAALAARAGVSGQALFDVVTTSGAGCGITKTALENIIDRKFEGTGSGIGTMHKDLTISLDMAEELGVPLFTASTAMQIFHQGKTKYPHGDNWICTRIIEDIVGAQLHR